MSPDGSKAAIRVMVREAMSCLGAGERAAAAAAVVSRVIALPEWRAARSVLLTLPLPDEIDVGPLVGHALAEGRCVGVPGWSEDRGGYLVREVGPADTGWVVGRFGVREPATHLRELDVGGLDLAIVPGVAFSRKGGRVGRGKGFYDRLLARFHGTACGVGFDQQTVPEVPVEPHDVTLNLVVTPSAVFRGRALL